MSADVCKDRKRWAQYRIQKLDIFTNFNLENLEVYSRIRQLQLFFPFSCKIKAAILSVILWSMRALTWRVLFYSRRLCRSLEIAKICESSKHCLSSHVEVVFPSENAMSITFSDDATSATYAAVTNTITSISTPAFCASIITAPHSVIAGAQQTSRCFKLQQRWRRSAARQCASWTGSYSLQKWWWYKMI